jgi:antitoxin YefM
MAVTASEARKNLFPLIEQVNDDRTPIEITSRRGDAVLLSRADYDALEETAHLLRVPANAKRLIESLQQAVAGQREEHDLVRGGSSPPRTAGRTTPTGSPRTEPPLSASTG